MSNVPLFTPIVTKHHDIPLLSIVVNPESFHRFMTEQFSPIEFANNQNILFVTIQNNLA